MSYFLKFLIIGLILFSSTLVAQTPKSFEHLSITDGLSNNNVLSIVKDKKGFIWVGTYNGLNRYNGYEFDVFRKESGNDAGLPDSSISSLCVDRNGNLWIGTKYGGLALFNPEKETFLNWVHNPQNPKSLSGNWIRSIFEDRSGKIWIMTGNNRLNKIIFEEPYNAITSSNISFENYTYESDTNLKILNIHESYDSDFYLSTSKGLLLFDSSKKQFVKLFDSFPLPNNNDIRNDIYAGAISFEPNKLLIGSYSGLFQLSIDSKKVRPLKLGQNDSSNFSFINTIKKDSKDNIWIGSNHGLLVYSTKSNKSIFYEHDFNLPGSIGHNHVQTIYEDDTGIIWVGTLDGGISKHDPNKIKFPFYYPEINFSENQNTRSFKVAYTTKDGHDWVGGDGGLFEYKDYKLLNVYKAGNNEYSLSFGGITGIIEMNNGDLMISTWGGGLNRLNRKTKRIIQYGYSNLEGVNNNESLSCCITDMIIDSQQVIWLSTVYGYLERFNPKTLDFKSFKIGDWIWDLLFNVEDNMIYLATENGIASFNLETMEKTHFVSEPDNLNSITHDRTWAIFKDSKNELWVGNYNGIENFNPRTNEFQLFTDPILDHLTVYKILEDNDRNLWLGTQQGISKFNPREGTFVHFTKEDGAYPEAKWGYKNPDGNFFFGGIYGFNFFNPSSILTNINIPPVTFTDFKVFNQSLEIKKGTALQCAIEATDKITLPSKSNSFSIEFAALNFSSTSKNNYAYKLEGFDNDWVYNGFNRNANYTNLNPGEYVFKVKASNNDLIWNNDGAELQITITPSFWETVFFKGILALLVFGLFSLFYHLRFRRIKIKKMLLEELVKKRTKELEILNSSLANQKEEILFKNSELNSMAIELNKSAKMQTNFFTGISHELRTPLTLIIAPLEKLVEETNHLPRINKSIRLVRKSSNSLLRLVNQLLDISKTDSGFIKLKLLEGNIAYHIKQIFNSFIAKSNELKIDYKFKSNLKNDICYFDLDKIEKIVSNLINNAFRFNNTDGLIQVILNGEYDKGKLNYLTIVVKDNGNGILEDEIEEIFELFKQGTQSKQNSVGSGWGIGLYIVKSLTELHHGEINVESKIDEGTVFSCRLGVQRFMFPNHTLIQKKSTVQYVENMPFDKDHTITCNPINESQLNSEVQSNRILIVEDNEELRNYLAEELSLSYKVLMASNGELGLELCRDKLPDLVVSDIMMPKMNGLELCKQIKKGSDTCHITTILLTAKATQEDELTGLNEGADDYIIKPFNITSLKLKIDNLLRTRLKLQQRFVNGAFNVKLFKGDERDKDLLTSCISIVEKSIANSELDAYFLASEMLISRSLLYSKLKSLTGQSVNEFIKNIRLKKASEIILHDWGRSMAEVCSDTGFLNQSHFNRCFRAKYGMSPKEYRKIKVDKSSS